MDKLASEITHVMDDLKNNVCGIGESNLRKSGQDWAVSALELFDGNLLGKALDISLAISKFCNEEERSKQKSIR